MKLTIWKLSGALLLLAALSTCSGGEPEGASLQWTPLATVSERTAAPAPAATAAPGETAVAVPAPVEGGAALAPAGVVNSRRGRTMAEMCGHGPGWQLAMAVARK